MTESLAVNRPLSPGDGLSERGLSRAAAGLRPTVVVAERDAALDFTKGALVLIMVLYHWLNYFVDVKWDVYRYLRFLTPSFIFITGFIVSNVYLPRHAAGDRVYGRLVQRGLKLLALFTTLNLLVNLTVKGSYNGRNVGLPGFVGNLYGIYVTGDGRAIFDVLVAIGYVLILAPALMIAARLSRWGLQVFVASVLAAAVLADLAGVRPPNLQLVSVGLVGMMIGAFPRDRINAILRHPVGLVLAYGAYVAAITRWNVVFILQIVGVCLSLLLIYLVGVRRRDDNALGRVIIEMGKYSLFAYIAQVAILQGLRRAFRGIDLLGLGVLIPFGVTLCLTVAFVMLVAASRARFATLNRLYRAVFA